MLEFNLGLFSGHVTIKEKTFEKIIKKLLKIRTSPEEAWLLFYCMSDLERKNIGFKSILKNTVSINL